MGATETVEAVAFGPPGADLVSGGLDGTVRIQRCDECGPLASVRALAERRLARQLTASERRATLARFGA
ncbi:MAG TPA: hypothetical protein VIH82_13685 [Acidimicrobiia bacterium]